MKRPRLPLLRTLPIIETFFLMLVVAGFVVADAQAERPLAPKKVVRLVPEQPQTFLSIQYPGAEHGRFNEFSEGVAVEIVELAHELGFTGIGHWQPEGGASMASMQVASAYTPLADSFMRPTSLLVDVSPNFRLAWARGRALGMKQMWYEGAASVINLGTPDAPLLRWITPDDAPLVEHRIRAICSEFAPDYLYIDDINKLGAYMGMPTGVTWGSPPDTLDFRIRAGDPPIKRSRNTVPAFNGAVRRGVAASGADTVIGYEPKTEGFWTDDQLGNPPWMQVVELAEIDAFPQATRADCFLVLNSLAAEYSLADIRTWIAKAHAKGYHAIVTWWVLKVALIRGGIDDPLIAVSARLNGVGAGRGQSLPAVEARCNNALMRDIKSIMPNPSAHTLTDIAGLGVTCPHCNHRVAIVKIHEGQVIKAGAFLEPTRVRIDKIMAASCPWCHGVLVAALWNRSHMNPTAGVVLLWPESHRARNAPEDLPAEIDHYYTQALKVLSISPEASALMARACLQLVIRSKLGIKKATLQQEIDEAHKRPEITKLTGETLHAIREFGNEVAHPSGATGPATDGGSGSDAAKTLLKVGVEEAIFTIEALELMFHDLYAVPSKTADMKARIRAAKPNAKLDVKPNNPA